MQEVADPVDRAFLDLREEGAEEVGDLEPQRLGLSAQYGQDGAVDGGCLLGAELPLGQGGQLDAEEGVGIADCVRDRAGRPLLEQRLACWPVEAAHGAHEHGQRPHVVAAFVCLERRPGLFEECPAAGHREQRHLEQDQRVHGLGLVECQLGGNGRSA